MFWNIWSDFFFFFFLTVSASHAPAPTNEGVQRFVSEDRQLGRNPGMTTCATCQQQVLTEVTYKVGTYAWIMCIVFILCG